MLLTEKEAAEKWCPQVPARGDNSHCLGGGCTAWRWQYQLYSLVYARFLNPGDTYNATHCVERRATDRGWCGRAGKPEGD